MIILPSPSSHEYAFAWSELVLLINRSAQFFVCFVIFVYILSCIFVCVTKSASVFLQSQQPLEDLDAQLRRALSPETVPVSTHIQVIKHFSVVTYTDIVYIELVYKFILTCFLFSMVTPGLSQWHTFNRASKYVLYVY